MLEVTPEHLANEIKAAEAAFKKPLEVRKTILEHYSGDAMADGNRRVPENHAHEYVSLVGPRLVANNPRVRVKSRLGGQSKMVAQVLQDGINRWISDTKHSRFLERMAVDFLTAWGVALVTLEQVTGFTDGEDVVTRPKVVPLDAGQVLWDPAALSWGQRRWTAHKYAMDHDDALERAKREDGWDTAALNNCAVDTNLDGLQAEAGQNVPKRKQIVVWEVYVPDADVEEGFNGAIYTLGSSADGAAAHFLRKPIPFYGPVGGPYVLFGAYTLPRRSIPASPLMMTWQTVEELNVHAMSLSRAAAGYKKIAIGDGFNRDSAEKINNAKDGETVVIPGFKKEQFVELNLGTLDQPRLDGYLMVRDRLQRGSAMDDQQRGKVSDATATAVMAVNETADTRMSGLNNRFTAADEELIYKVGWYMHAERSVAIPLGEQGNGQVAIYRGGAEDWDKFDFYEFEIERYSMERTTEAMQQRRGMELMRLVMEAAPNFPLISPFVDIKAWVTAVGDYLNLPELGEIVNPDGAAAVLNAQMAQESGQSAQGGGAPQQAKFAGDVSPTVRKAENKQPKPTGPVGKSGNASGGEAKKSAVPAY